MNTFHPTGDCVFIIVVLFRGETFPNRKLTNDNVKQNKLIANFVTNYSVTTSYFRRTVYFHHLTQDVYNSPLSPSPTLFFFTFRGLNMPYKNSSCKIQLAAEFYYR